MTTSFAEIIEGKPPELIEKLKSAAKATIPRKLVEPKADQKDYLDQLEAAQRVSSEMLRDTRIGPPARRRSSTPP